MILHIYTYVDWLIDWFDWSIDWLIRRLHIANINRKKCSTSLRRISDLRSKRSAWKSRTSLGNLVFSTVREIRCLNLWSCKLQTNFEINSFQLRRDCVVLISLEYVRFVEILPFAPAALSRNPPDHLRCQRRSCTGLPAQRLKAESNSLHRSCVFALFLCSFSIFFSRFSLRKLLGKLLDNQVSTDISLGVGSSSYCGQLREAGEV